MIALVHWGNYGRGRNRSRAILDLLSVLLIALGIASMGYVAYVLVSARNFQAVESAKIARARMAVQPTRTFAPRVVAEGEVIGELQLPRLEWSAIVVQGDSDDVLRRAAGHVPGTALPGQTGNVAIAGHRDTVFRALRDVRVGDTITLRTPDGNEIYRVNSTEVVPPTDMDVLQSTGKNELTLITCFPFHYIGHAPKRFIVRAVETKISEK